MAKVSYPKEYGYCPVHLIILEIFTLSSPGRFYIVVLALQCLFLNPSNYVETIQQRSLIFVNLRLYFLGPVTPLVLSD